MRPLPPWGVGGRVPSCHPAALARCICACCTRSGKLVLPHTGHIQSPSEEASGPATSAPRQHHVSATSAPRQHLKRQCLVHRGNDDTRKSSLYFPIPPFHGQELRYSCQLQSPNASIASILTPGSQGVIPSPPLPHLLDACGAPVLVLGKKEGKKAFPAAHPKDRQTISSYPTLPVRADFL